MNLLRHGMNSLSAVKLQMYADFVKLVERVSSRKAGVLHMEIGVLGNSFPEKNVQEQIHSIEPICLCNKVEWGLVLFYAAWDCKPINNKLFNFFKIFSKKKY